MSPEQAAGVPVDRRTDLFSLGVVLYRMTTGAPPDVVVTPPVERNPAVPVTLSDLVVRLLALDPDTRPASAAAVVAELRSVEAELAGAVRVVPLGAVLPNVVGSSAPDPFSEIDATEADPTPHARSKSARWLWPAVALTVLGAALAAAVATGLIRLGKPRPPEHVELQPESKPVPPVVKKDVPKKDVPKKDVPTVPPFDPATADAERKAAEALRGAAHLVLQTEDGKEHQIGIGHPVPNTPFRVVGVGLDKELVEEPRAAFVRALSDLPHLTLLFDNRNILRWPAADLGRLAAGPSASTLREMRFPTITLTVGLLDELKKFTQLSVLYFDLGCPDVVLLRLPEAVPNLEEAYWQYVGYSKDATATGANALSGLLKLKRVGVINASGHPMWLRAIARSPELEHLKLAYAGFTDENLVELRAAKKLTTLSLDAMGIADASLESIAKIESLKVFEYRRLPKITEDGLKKLKQARPELTIKRLP